MRTVLVDGNALWWRTYSIADFPYAAEYRFLEILRKLRLETGGNVLVAWDSWCQWRRDLLSTYKNRDRTPEMAARRVEVYAARDEFIQNLQYIVPCYFGEDCEADDIIALLTRQVAGHKIIYGSDHDFFQLLHFDVSMRRVRFNPTRVETVSLTNLHTLEGYNPAHAALVQAICGCASDNVPGCRVPQKHVLAAIRYSDHYCGALEDLQRLGAETLTPGWQKRWNDHFLSGAFDRNLQLVTLGHRPIKLLCMYRPNLEAASRYLNDRGFLTIKHAILDDLLCAF